jgi:hypothetical protein
MPGPENTGGPEAAKKGQNIEVTVVTLHAPSHIETDERNVSGHIYTYGGLTAATGATKPIRNSMASHGPRRAKVQPAIREKTDCGPGVVIYRKKLQLFF